MTGITQDLKALDQPREWLIRKGAYFYRANFCGYTGDKGAAGRYTEAEALREAAVEPWHMAAIHESKVTDTEYSRVIADLAKEEASHAKTLASLRTAQTRIESDAATIAEREAELAEAQSRRESAELALGYEIEFKQIAIARAEAAEAEVARLKEALAKTAIYLDELENELISADADMMIGDIRAPGIVATDLRAALQPKAPDHAR